MGMSQKHCTRTCMYPHFKCVCVCTQDRHNARIQIHLSVVHIVGFALVWFTQLLLLCEQNTFLAMYAMFGVVVLMVA